MCYLCAGSFSFSRRVDMDSLSPDCPVKSFPAGVLIPLSVIDRDLMTHAVPEFEDAGNFA